MKTGKKASERKSGSLNLLSATALVLFVGLVAATGYVAWDYISDPRNQPVRSVEIKGEFRYLDRVNLQKVVAKVIDGGFFSTDIHQVRDAVLELPWVEDVSIRRVWPNKLLIQVRERTAIARWGDDALLSDKGQAFHPLKPATQKLKLHLYGRDEDAVEVLAFYRQVEGYLEVIGDQVERAGMDPRREWRIELTSGMEIVLGNRFPEQRLRRFLKVYQVIGRDDMHPVRVDLRYEQGFAVDWNRVDGKRQEGET